MAVPESKPEISTQETASDTSEQNKSADDEALGRSSEKDIVTNPISNDAVYDKTEECHGEVAAVSVSSNKAEEQHVFPK